MFVPGSSTAVNSTTTVVCNDGDGAGGQLGYLSPGSSPERNSLKNSTVDACEVPEIAASAGIAG
jgi:hypothetical protein